MTLNIAAFVKQAIQFIYHLSPYFWVDRHYKLAELEYPVDSKEQQVIRQKRLFLSELYIVGWMVLAFFLAILSGAVALPDWLMIFFILRIVGIMNKELGVILFGTCKITEGGMLSATGRVIVLAMVNYLTALFLYATIYQTIGHYQDVPPVLQQGWDLAPYIDAINRHFTMSGAFVPADILTWMVAISQAIFCFMFGTIVISLFVSLLNIKPLKA